MEYIKIYLIAYVVLGVSAMLILTLDNYYYFKYTLLNILNNLVAKLFLILTPLTLIFSLFLGIKEGLL